MQLSKVNETIRKIFSKFFRSEYSSIIESYVFLFAINIVNYLFPFITFPYLVRVLKVEGYGLLSLAQSLAGYFSILSNYGFDIIGIQKIAIKRENKEESGEVLTEIIGAKLLFVIAGFLILSCTVFLVPKLRGHYLIFFLSYLAILVEALNPYWFFRGIEKLTSIAILTLISKALYTIGIFTLVKSQKDLNLVPVLGSIANILVVFGAFHKIIKLGYIPRFPRFQNVITQAKESFTIFLAQVTKSLNTTSTTFILGIMTNNTYVGYFAAAQRIVAIIFTFVQITQQAAYPYANRLVATSKNSAKKFFKKFLLIVISLGGLLSLMLLLIANVIIKILLGQAYIPSLATLRILSLFLFFAGLENTLSILIMVPLGFKRELAKILWSSSIINIILTILTVRFFNHVGAAISLTITYIYTVSLLYTFLKKRKAL